MREEVGSAYRQYCLISSTLISLRRTAPWVTVSYQVPVDSGKCGGGGAGDLIIQWSLNMQFGRFYSKYVPSFPIGMSNSFTDAGAPKYRYNPGRTDTDHISIIMQIL